MIILAYKKIGESNLQASKRYINKLSVKDKFTFSGRLDPLAEGAFLILTGKDRYRKEQFNKLGKEYELHIVFGIKTDSADLLGKLKKIDSNARTINLLEIKRQIKKMQGKINWPYPCFSSKKFKGKPLFLWALEGRCPKLRPKYNSYIYRIKILSVSKLKAQDLIAMQKYKIGKLKRADLDFKFADYRKKEVLNSWQKLKEYEDLEFLLLKLKVLSASSVYMRDLAERLADSLGTIALASYIKRISIGNVYKIPYLPCFWYKKLYNINNLRQY